MIHQIQAQAHRHPAFLLDSAAVAPDDGAHMSLVELARYSNYYEAELARGLLDHAGIMAFTFDGGMNIAEGLGMMIPVRLMVIAEEREAAYAILHPPEPRSAGSGATGPWGDREPC